MTNDDKTKDEKLQCDINREATKISVSLSGKIDKYEYLTSKEMLPYDQSRIIEQGKLTYSPLAKAFEKEIKAIEHQGVKRVETLKVLKPNTQKVTVNDALSENILS